MLQSHRIRRANERAIVCVCVGSLILNRQWADEIKISHKFNIQNSTKNIAVEKQTGQQSTKPIGYFRCATYWCGWKWWRCFFSASVLCVCRERLVCVLLLFFFFCSVRFIISQTAHFAKQFEIRRWDGKRRVVRVITNLAAVAICMFVAAKRSAHIVQGQISSHIKYRAFRRSIGRNFVCILNLILPIWERDMCVRVSCFCYSFSSERFGNSCELVNYLFYSPPKNKQHIFDGETFVVAVIISVGAKINLIELTKEWAKWKQ